MSTSDNISDPDGAVGAGAAGAPDIATVDGGDATGGGSPGNPDDMGADDEVTLEEYGTDKGPNADVDKHLDGPDMMHPTNWRIT